MDIFEIGSRYNTKKIHICHEHLLWLKKSGILSKKVDKEEILSQKKILKKREV